MPQISYDFSDAAEGGDFITLENGLYVFKFVKAEAGKSGAGNPKAVVTLEVAAAQPSNEAFVGGMITQHWPTTGKAAFRFRSFLAALGALKGKDKGSLKLEKHYGDEIGARTIQRSGDQADDSGNYMVFNDLQGILPGDQVRKMLGVLDDDEDEEEELEDEDEEDEEEEEEAEEEETEEDDDEEDEDEDDEDEEDDEEEEEEEYLTVDDLKTMKLPELKELAEENDISTRAPKGKKLTVAVMRKRLQVLFEEEDEDEEEAEEDPF